MVHQGVKEYIDIDSVDKYDSRLEEVALKIEDNTLDVFKYIDSVKEHRCENAVLERSRDKVTQTDNPVEHAKEIARLKQDSINKTKEVVGCRSKMDYQNQPRRKTPSRTFKDNSDDTQWESF